MARTNVLQRAYLKLKKNLFLSTLIKNRKKLIILRYGIVKKHITKPVF